MRVFKKQPDMAKDLLPSSFLIDEGGHIVYNLRVLIGDGGQNLALVRFIIEEYDGCEECLKKIAEV
jgi:hypothetical protein